MKSIWLMSSCLVKQMTHTGVFMEHNYFFQAYKNIKEKSLPKIRKQMFQQQQKKKKLLNNKLFFLVYQFIYGNICGSF